MTPAPAPLAIASGHGDVGGGEVMLLAIAEALRAAGAGVTVIGPSEPGALVALAAGRGLDVEALPAAGRRAYLLALARWRVGHRDVPLWCNGLAPALATAGMGPRIVHLHQLPGSRHRVALTVARRGASAVLAPSEHVASRVRGARVLANWTAPLAPVDPPPGRGPEIRVGFLGRLTRDKGVDVLARAIGILRRGEERPLRLVLAGEIRFADAEDRLALEGALAPIADITERRGWVEPSTFFAEVDVAVFPSRVPESFGLVAAEAMAAGVPFVISDAGALPEVAGGAHPWVARAGDDVHLAAVLADAIAALGTPRATAAVRGARSRWEARFSPDSGRARVFALLEDLGWPPRQGAR